MRNKVIKLFILLLSNQFCYSQGTVYQISYYKDSTGVLSRNETSFGYGNKKQLLGFLDEQTSTSQYIVIEDTVIKKISRKITTKINSKELQLITPNLKYIGYNLTIPDSLQIVEIFANDVHYISFRLFKSKSITAISIKASNFSHIAKMSINRNKKHAFTKNSKFEFWTDEVLEIPGK